jgi:hypothetical protein
MSKHVNVTVTNVTSHTHLWFGFCQEIDRKQKDQRKISKIFLLIDLDFSLVRNEHTSVFIKPCNKLNGEGKFVAEPKNRTMETYREVKVTFHTFLTSALDSGDLQAVAALFSEKEPPVLTGLDTG